MRRQAILLVVVSGCIPVAEEHYPVITVGIVPPRVANRVPASLKKKDQDSPNGALAPLLRQVAPEFPKPAQQVVSAPKPKRNTGLLVGLAKEQLYRRFIPDGSTAFLRDEDLVWYDENVMPRVFQVSDEGGLPKLFRETGQVTANREFPWDLPGGVSEGSNHKELRFLRPPVEGGPAMEWWNIRKLNNDYGGVDWRFLPGTMVGEIILVTGADGLDRTSIVRTRTKRTNGSWRVNQYQPIVSHEDLTDALAKRGLTIMGEAPVTFQSLSSDHPRNRFLAMGHVEPVPNMAPEVVDDILKEPFRVVGSNQWRFDPDVVLPVVQPDQGFSLFPRGFQGAFLPVGTTSCMRCHEDAGRLVVEPSQGERRYRIRGNDGIFSVQPFDPASIGGPRIELSPRLLAAGLLRHREGFP